MQSNFLLSIVIATHNRQKYAVYAIESILKYTSENVEVVVSDSSDIPNTKEFEDLLRVNRNNARLKYHHHSQRLSMTENYNYAVDAASGEFICLIGDDDCVSPDISEFVSLMKIREIRVLTPKIITTYSWPDFITQVWGDKHAGNIYIDKYSGVWEKRNSKKQLDLALSNACQGTDELPKLYHGIVQRKLLLEIKDRIGDYFFGISPDISSSISIASMTDHYYIIDYPLTIPGASGGSNTGRSALNKHRGSLDDDEHIKPFKNLMWDDRIPRFFSVETTWSQAAIETLTKFSIEDKFNFERLMSLCFINHNDYKEKINFSINYCNENGSNVTSFGIFFEGVRIRLLRIKAIIKRLKNPQPNAGKVTITNSNNILQAMDKYTAYLEKKNRR
ncbi:glycosyltransferase family 2 protein [Enterovibrio norvegicus]|uniref:glycosyltransferase family 2 protein n=1 Tax=Enterovibrio norvegicus TaxID=188144 RepID=UPI00354AF584